MKRRKFVLSALVLFASVALLGACGEEPAGGGNVITVLNQSSWHDAKALEFYDLTGKRVAEAPIESGRAAADLEKEGVYIVQVKDAPESVNYGYAEAADKEIGGFVVLSPESKGSAPPILKIVDSEEQDKLKKFQVGVFILEDGVLASGYPVQLCYEPQDDIGGYCLGPTATDVYGQFYGPGNEGPFHYIVYSKENRTETIYDGRGDLSASRRFLVAEIKAAS